jgi:hypothetical protein
MIDWGRACLASTHDFAGALASDDMNESFMTSPSPGPQPSLHLLTKIVDNFVNRTVP